MNFSTFGGGWAPTNSATTWPSLNALTAGMPWMRNAAGELLVGVGVELGEVDLVLALGHELLEHGRELSAGAAPFGPEVDDDGTLVRAVDDVLLERRLGGVEDHTTRIASGPCLI